MTHKEFQADEQEDVLRKKDHVTRGPRGLQQWGGPLAQEGIEGESGTGSQGTAARSARITGAQTRTDEAQTDVGHGGRQTEQVTPSRAGKAQTTPFNEEDPREEDPRGP